MPLEIEAKIKVHAHEPIVDTLCACGARRIRRVLETNYILDDSARRLRAAGKGLRVRQIVVHEGEPLLDTITFKGPIRKARYKTREERNVQVADGAQALALLQSLGYLPILIFEKRRETWKLTDCLVELDDLPLLGTYVEIEGPQEASVRRVQQLIGLAHETNISEGYIQLLLDSSKPAKGNHVEIRFQ